MICNYMIPLQLTLNVYIKMKLYLLFALFSPCFMYAPLCEKTGLRCFRPGPTPTGLYGHRRWLEACNVVFIKKRDCTIRVAKTKALISFAVTAKLICVFVFAYSKIRFSHNEAFMIVRLSVFKITILLLNSMCSCVFIDDCLSQF